MLRLLRRKSNVLLLDDDPSMQRLVSTLLKRGGHRVDVVSSGAHALQLIDQHDYDVLLLDVMTPTEGGLTVIRRLRETKPEMLRKVILVTGTPESVLRAVAGDVAGTVLKPFRAEDLMAAIDRVLES
jgi:CheY-like chemotaxis protein